ncbi:actin nucleation-promoting factor WAS [Trichomycterus rosablanca]|uniref:actin nucleation-promoting factor WAS n=1 Tax=Trichomycterus rosablanca TaxID=2290929 RepID=UPI002F35FCA3
MRRGSKQKSQDSTGCSLLSPQENEQVIDLLGRRCVPMCTTVVQLFMALPHSPSIWTLQHTGILCFVKDNPNRSYFIRLFDIKASKLIWEQEIYNQFTYCKARSFFHTFNADDCQVGLNFANEQEADRFFNAVDDKINQRCKQLEKRNRKSQRDHDGFPLSSSNDGGNSPFPLENIQNQAAPSKSKKEKKSKEKKNKKKGSKISKELIGAPSGFTHVSHVGMETNSIDPDLMQLLSRAGISEADMNDSETSQLIYDVIERSGGMDAVKKELNQQERPLPPPPSTRRTSLNTASPSAPIPSQPRLGPLPPPPGGTQFNETPRSSVRRSGPLPPPPGQATQGGRKGALPQPPAAATMPARGGSLPPVSGGHSGPPPPVPGERALPALPSRSGPFPPPPGRSSGPPPFPEGARRESLPSVPGGHNGSMPPVPGGRSGPPPPSLPGRRTGSLPPPPSSHSRPPPPPETFLPPPPVDFLPPPECEDLPPPPVSFDSQTYPQTYDQYSSDMDSYPPPVSVNSSKGGPPPPPPPPPPSAPPPSAPPPPNLGSSPAPPVASSGGEGGRGALLDQIRLGTKLKMVTANPNPPPSATGDSEEGIVGALMMVMQKRSQAIRPSDDEDEFDDEEDDDDEWD